MSKTTYFKSCKTKQEAKQLFRTLAKKYHPDAETGDHDTMVAIIAEYEEVIKTLPSTPQEKPQFETDEHYNLHVSAEMQEILSNISHLPITIDIIGTWLWISGDTRPYKAYLTAYNFLWCPKKKMYQWHIDRGSHKGHKPMDIDSIKDKYGSTTVPQGYRPSLQR